MLGLKRLQVITLTSRKARSSGTDQTLWHGQIEMDYNGVQ